MDVSFKTKEKKFTDQRIVGTGNSQFGYQGRYNRLRWFGHDEYKDDAK